MPLLWKKWAHNFSLPCEKEWSKTWTTQNENKIRVRRNRWKWINFFTHSSIQVVQANLCQLENQWQDTPNGTRYQRCIFNHLWVHPQGRFPELPLRKCPIWLKTYTDRELNIHVSYGDQRAPLVFLVIAWDGPTLLGQNWLQYIHLNWERIHTVSKTDTTNALNNLLEKQSDLFTDELAKFKLPSTSALTLIRNFSILSTICNEACDWSWTGSTWV
jgi:hypothetical protein